MGSHLRRDSNPRPHSAEAGLEPGAPEGATALRLRQATALRGGRCQSRFRLSAGCFFFCLFLLLIRRRFRRPPFAFKGTRKEKRDRKERLQARGAGPARAVTSSRARRDTSAAAAELGPDVPRWRRRGGPVLRPRGGAALGAEGLGRPRLPGTAGIGCGKGSAGREGCAAGARPEVPAPGPGALRASQGGGGAAAAPGPGTGAGGAAVPAREPRMAPVCPVGPGGERDGWWGRAVLTRLVVAASQEEGAPRGPAHSSPGCRDLFTRRQLPWLFFVCHPYELSAAV